MSLLDPIYNYCERTSSTLWAEPLNLVSNIAFFIASWMLYKSYRASQKPNREAAFLIFLVLLIGIGSTLFHMFANRLTMIGDVVPIAIFTLSYLWISLRRLARFSVWQTVASVALFLLVSAAAAQVPEAYRFNGSISYFPCAAALFIIGGYLHYRRHLSAPLIIKAASWFVLSLTFRSMDRILCAAIPIGTHFLWHAINGIVLYLLTSAIARAKPD